MDALKLLVCETFFERDFYKLKGNSFQDFFSEIMEKRYPADFMRCRPWGNIGDRKNDGYLQSRRSLFQVYAPNEMKQADAISKIDEDFNEALPYWQQYFHTWIFTHNSRNGLSPDVLRKLLELGRQHTYLNITNWGYQELWNEVKVLQENDIISLLRIPGALASLRDLTNVRMTDIQMVIRHIADQAEVEEGEIKPVDPEKLSANGLSSNVKRLLTLGMAKAELVKQFFRDYYDTNYGDRIATTLKNKYNSLKDESLMPDEIFQELQKYISGDFITIPKYQVASLAIFATVQFLRRG